MKLSIIISLFLSIVSYCSQAPTLSPTTYFIYVKPGDKLLDKIHYHNTIAFTYNCKCYARANDLRFRCMDTRNSYIADTLPKKIYSMKEFGELANKFRAAFKNINLGQSSIYIIEDSNRHRYSYNKTVFFTIEGDD